MPNKATCALAAVLVFPGAAFSAWGTDRPAELIRLVRQDCGSCHGLTLRGGLGPALTATALRGRSREFIFTTILQGHPGTPMPPFRGILNEADAQWITTQLLAGFPEEP